MVNPTITIKLSVTEILEALSDDNRFHTSRKLGKRWEDVTNAELLNHYILYSDKIGMTVVGFNVEPSLQTEGWGCKKPIHNHLERVVPPTLGLLELDMELAGAD